MFTSTAQQRIAGPGHRADRSFDNLGTHAGLWLPARLKADATHLESRAEGLHCSRSLPGPLRWWLCTWYRRKAGNTAERRRKRLQ